MSRESVFNSISDAWKPTKFWFWLSSHVEDSCYEEMLVKWIWSFQLQLEKSRRVKEEISESCVVDD